MRRQELALQRRDGALRRGRRRPDPGAVLGVLPRPGEARGGQPGVRARPGRRTASASQARDLAAAITPNTKALILNYPCNPTGATYTREQLEEIAEVCVREQIWVISDEIYEKLLYDGQRYTSIASLNEKIKKLTVVINGFSKAFSMTGWRLGYAAGPREIIAACSKIQSHNTSNATSFVQKAGVVALRECSMEVERMRQEFERRRNAIVYRLRALPERLLLLAVGRLLRHAQRDALPGQGVRRRADPQHLRPRRTTCSRRRTSRWCPARRSARPRTSASRSPPRWSASRRGAAASREALARLEEPRRLRPRALNNVVTKVATYAETRPVVGLESRNALLDEASRAPVRRTPTSSGTRRSPASWCSCGPTRRTSPTSTRRTSTPRRSRATSSRTPWSTRSRTSPAARPPGS